MYTVINQCCPNHRLVTCSSTVATPTQVVPLVLFTLWFFLSHVWATHSASPFRPRFVLIANLQWAFQMLQHFFFSKFFFLSHMFHSKPTAKNIVGKGHGRVSAPFLFVLFSWTFVPYVDSSRWLLHSLLLPRTFPCSCLGCPFFFSFTQHVTLTMVRPSRRQRPLRSSFAPTMRRTGHLVLPHWGAVCCGRHQVTEVQVHQCFNKPARSSPLWHFGHSRCLQRIRSILWSFEKCFAWAVPPPTQAVQLLLAGSHSQTHWSLHHRSRSIREFTQGTVFILPQGKIFARPGPAASLQPPERWYLQR